jgi:hypothetical protein
MGGACSTNGGEEECIYDIGGIARKKETCEHSIEPSGSVKCWEILESGCTIGGFSRRAQPRE